MSDCNAVQARFTEYLDGRLNGHEMQRIAVHLEDCRECAHEWKLLRQVQSSLSALGPVPEPPNLRLRIRVAVSQERARSRSSCVASVRLAAITAADVLSRDARATATSVTAINPTR